MQLVERLLHTGIIMMLIELFQILFKAAVHYNEWAQLDKKDFIPVVDATKKFLNSFFCSEENCSSIVLIFPSKGSSEVIRCNCNSFNLNLKKK